MAQSTTRYWWCSPKLSRQANSFHPKPESEADSAPPRSSEKITQRLSTTNSGAYKQRRSVDLRRTRSPGMDGFLQCSTLPLRPRMRSIINLRQMLEIQMRIDLRGRNIRMPQQLLHTTQIA